jgi:hypothetical protein
MTEGEFIGDVIAAHGGRSRWDRVGHVDVEFSAGGYAFASRQLDPALLRGVVGRFDAHIPAARVDAFGPRRVRGEFANGGVRLRGRDGEVLIDRPQARNRFGDVMRQVRWDEGDLFYFASYAMWNYLCFPFLLGTNALRRARVRPWRAAGWRLDAEFAAEFPTHSRRQAFYFDSSLRLIRHAYSADVIGPYARAIHHCANYVCTDGIWLARRRLVLPRLWGASSLPLPTLVRIEIANIKYGAGEVAAPASAESAACR